MTREGLGSGESELGPLSDGRQMVLEVNTISWKSRSFCPTGDPEVRLSVYRESNTLWEGVRPMCRTYWGPSRLDSGGYSSEGTGDPTPGRVQEDTLGREGQSILSILNGALISKAIIQKRCETLGIDLVIYCLVLSHTQTLTTSNSL